MEVGSECQVGGTEVALQLESPEHVTGGLIGAITELSVDAGPAIIFTDVDPDLIDGGALTTDAFDMELQARRLSTFFNVLSIASS